MHWMMCNDGWYAGIAVPERATVAEIEDFEKLVSQQFVRLKQHAPDSGFHEYVDCPTGTGCEKCIGYKIFG